MPKVKSNVASRKRRKRTLKKVKGQFGRRSKNIRTATESLNRALAYSFRDRKVKKRSYRSLWVARVNAICRANDISYSAFMNGLKKAKIDLNRKMLAEIAIHDKKAFKELIKLAVSAKNKKS